MPGHVRSGQRILIRRREPDKKQRQTYNKNQHIKQTKIGEINRNGLKIAGKYQRQINRRHRK